MIVSKIVQINKFGGVRITIRTQKQKNKGLSLNEKIIDYLQLSINYREETCRELEHEEINGLQWYKRGYRDNMGVRRYFGNPNSDKALVILSGTTLHNMRVVQWTDQQIVSDYLEKGAKITRIDFAITDFVDTSLILPSDIEQAFANKLISSSLITDGCKSIVGVRPRTDSEDTDYKSTETCYIGSMKKRAKKGIFRCYDKGLELDLDKYLITRLELEDRGDKAHTSAKRFADCGDIGSVFKTRIDIHTEQFQSICDSPSIDTSRGNSLVKDDIELEYDKRWDWLFKQVSPTLKKAIAYDLENGKGTERLDDFLFRSGLAYQENEKIDN